MGGVGGRDNLGGCARRSGRGDIFMAWTPVTVRLRTCATWSLSYVGDIGIKAVLP